MPLAAMPWMSEMAFWVLPCPSAYSKLVMFGQLATSFLAAAVGPSGQLLHPKRSVGRSVAFSEPHHDGRLPPPGAAVAPPPVPDPELPQPTTSKAVPSPATMRANVKE